MFLIEKAYLEVMIGSRKSGPCFMLVSCTKKSQTQLNVFVIVYLLSAAVSDSYYIGHFKNKMALIALNIIDACGLNMHQIKKKSLAL